MRQKSGTQQLYDPGPAAAGKAPPLESRGNPGETEKFPAHPAQKIPRAPLGPGGDIADEAMAKA